MYLYSKQVRRYLPVANLTRTRQAVIIEPFNPERFFVRTFNATSLYILSICEVCGSYQCPFCPFYSGSPSIKGIRKWPELYQNYNNITNFTVGTHLELIYLSPVISDNLAINCII